jgi:FdhD protein
MRPADCDPLSPRPECAAGHALQAVVRIGGPQATAAQDAIACEVAVALEYNGLSHAVLLATPLHLEELALGFSYTEGIITSPADVLDIDVEEAAEGLVVRLRIVNARLHALKQRRRQLAGRTGCGLCGVETLAQVRRPLPPLAAPGQPWRLAAIERALAGLRAQQPLHNLTGATHAAAWARADGEIAWAYEDVGRHNALDKLIGRLLREPVDRTQGLLLISSRASFEMVQKAQAASLRALIAVSAPTALAVQMAREAPMLLAGFARDDRCTIYSHPEYLDLDRSCP